MGPDVCRNSCTSAYNSALATVCFRPGSKPLFQATRCHSPVAFKATAENAPTTKASSRVFATGTAAGIHTKVKLGAIHLFCLSPQATSFYVLKQTFRHTLRNTSPCSGSHTPHPICLLCAVIQVTEPFLPAAMAPAGHTHTACVSKKGSGNHRRDTCHGSRFCWVGSEPCTTATAAQYSSRRSRRVFKNLCTTVRSAPFSRPLPPWCLEADCQKSSFLAPPAKAPSP